MKKLLFAVAVLGLCSCGSNRDSKVNCSADELFAQPDSVLAHSDEFSDTIVIKYAKGLKVSYQPDGVHVTVSNPDPNAKMSKKEEFVVSGPSKRFICTTALQLGNFEILGLEDRIVGMNSLKNLFSSKMKEQIKDGKTVKIGKEGNFDLESVLESKPDYIFVSASKHGGFEVLKETGIPLISHHGYKETDPLGQAEWIKLVGILTGETRRANAVFADIEAKYSKLQEEVANSKTDKMPTVVSGRQIRDGWYYVGGKSYMAQIFKDAGAEYVMGDSQESGGVTEDFETVYVKGLKADFWQTDGAHDGEFTLGDLAAEDERYSSMESFKKKQVVFCNLSETPYRELGGVQPHYILADFVKAFHPELLPNYEPKFYKLIK